MRSLITLSLFAFSLAANAQTLATVYDANGFEVGQPSQFTVQTPVFRPDGVIANIDLTTGEILDRARLYYLNNVCDGQGYITDLRDPVYTRLWQLEIPDVPNPVFIVDENLEYQPREVVASMGDDGLCQIGSALLDTAIVSPLNPEDYGLVMNGEGEWRYPAPLTVKAKSVAVAGEAIFCSGFESCPAGPAVESGPLYVNGLLKDANGEVVGFWWYGPYFISLKGYWFSLYYPEPGYYRNLPAFFESDDCTGQPYMTVNNLPGEVFVAHDGIDSHYVAYSELNAVPTTRTTRSLRRYNPTYGHGYCESPKIYTNEYVPVYPNDPEVTGIPGDLGNRENPYPAPLTIEN